MATTIVDNAAATQALMDSVNGTKKATTTADEAQNRFLKLLTTQLQNQDPLNPLDNAQMTSQIAQINTVSGIEKLNATIEKMMSSSLDTEAMQATAMVGRNVMIVGNGMELTEAGAVAGLELDANADKVEVTIKDANGLLVRNLNLGDLDAGLHNFAWDGKNNAGAAAAKGEYSISVAATRNGEKVASRGLQLASVVSVTRTPTGTSIDLGSFGKMALSNIKQIF